MLIQDIFFSFQGEGILIGYPQLFIRFAGCNLICEYCDENTGGDFQDLSIDAVLDKVTPFYKKKPHSIVLTGGEPLLQVASIRELIPHFKKWPLFLETNGTLPDHLAEVMDAITYFSVDYKIGYEKEFIDFLSLLRDKENVCVKIVLLRDFNILDVQRLGKIVASINKSIPIILQPVTPIRKITHPPTWQDILRGYQAVSNLVDTVRVIPQAHKMMGIP